MKRLGEEKIAAQLAKAMDRWLGVERKWDEPALDPGLSGIIPPGAAD